MSNMTDDLGVTPKYGDEGGDKVLVQIGNRQAELQFPDGCGFKNENGVIEVTLGDGARFVLDTNQQEIYFETYGMTMGYMKGPSVSNGGYSIKVNQHGFDAHLENNVLKLTVK